MEREPKFTRSDIAKILSVSPLTIANREKAGKYPAPKRDLNNYRIYDLRAVFSLQLVTYGHIDPKPVISVLYDKGFTDPKELTKMIDKVLENTVQRKVSQ